LRNLAVFARPETGTVVSGEVTQPGPRRFPPAPGRSRLFRDPEPGGCLGTRAPRVANRPDRHVGRCAAYEAGTSPTLTS